MGIGTSWVTGSWVEDSWFDGSWGIEGAGITCTLALTAFAARCALLGQIGEGTARNNRRNTRRLTSTREDIPIPAEQPAEVQQSVRAALYRLDHTSTKSRIPLPAKAEPTVQQSIRAIRKRLERLP
jgi:hypothetical protein